MIALSATYCVTLWNWQHPVLRLTSPAADQILGHLTALCIPVVLAVLGFLLPRRWIGLITSLICLALVLASLVPILFLPEDFQQVVELGYDPDYKLIEHLDFQGYRVGLYQTSCQLLLDCYDGVAVREERPILPGVLLVREFSGFSPSTDIPANSVNVERLGKNRIRVSVRENGVRPSSRVYQFHPWVWL